MKCASMWSKMYLSMLEVTYESTTIEMVHYLVWVDSPTYANAAKLKSERKRVLRMCAPNSLKQMRSRSNGERSSKWVDPDFGIYWTDVVWVQMCRIYS